MLMAYHSPAGQVLGRVEAAHRCGVTYVRQCERFGSQSGYLWGRQSSLAAMGTRIEAAGPLSGRVVTGHRWA